MKEEDEKFLEDQEIIVFRLEVDLIRECLNPYGLPRVREIEYLFRLLLFIFSSNGYRKRLYLDHRQEHKKILPKFSCLPGFQGLLKVHGLKFA